MNYNIFKLSNSNKSNIALIKSNSSVILIDNNNNGYIRYPLLFIKIQDIVFTTNAINLFHNIYEDFCRLRTYPTNDFDVVNKKYVDDIIG